ncbi:MAG: hypothetical protein KatS3mg085_447 [Candidatus Dojkabacteria bacterium]|nr:MAG: hypothetical protein KatS3mg085_447 [Candidatus Dojkabacteria bacterium]
MKKLLISLTVLMIFFQFINFNSYASGSSDAACSDPEVRIGRIAFLTALATEIINNPGIVTYLKEAVDNQYDGNSSNDYFTGHSLDYQGTFCEDNGKVYLLCTAMDGKVCVNRYWHLSREEADNLAKSENDSTYDDEKGPRFANTLIPEEQYDNELYRCGQFLESDLNYEQQDLVYSEYNLFYVLRNLYLDFFSSISVTDDDRDQVDRSIADIYDTYNPKDIDDQYFFSTAPYSDWFDINWNRLYSCVNSGVTQGDFFYIDREKADSEYRLINDNNNNNNNSNIISSKCNGIDCCAENDQQCRSCVGAGGVWTAVGCIDPSPVGVLTRLVQLGLGIMGGVALIQIIYAGIMYQSGNEEKIRKAREQLLATLTGLAVLVFSVLIVQILGVNLLDTVPAGLL